jgi:hypothetical protein
VTPPDPSPPRLRLVRAYRQKVARNGFVVVGALCNEVCTLSANASFKPSTPSSARHFVPASLRGPARTLLKLRLRVSHKGLKTLRGLARRSRRARVRVRVTARDSAGNAVTRTCYVTAVP